ncbi:MAG: PEP-CTERM sorting domain-containing protein [Chroococcales cyanobacterium metabat2.561]|uniref:PEP-CTERM sorting domain-containing protein n=1 Tax=Microcystis aeruginosa Ma_SC_T_19800800_S464 TaxID=2486257 RepID=A0A552DX92_MICAE|nr:MAG: PEP-CTERM sorting domain-containing protein [Chroococcales cyanobacterium metabat2.561]TRU26852.1 MAG: PEP-CTERM sorting domain-containing protein [Microcystis aeruginosa Ma_SC_T_19800800_S464]
MNKNQLLPTLALAGATSLAAMLTPVAAMAIPVVTTFNVNRSWSQGSDTASLVGTVDVPVGSYTIQNGTPNPFTNVNLTLTVNGNAVTLNAVDLTDTLAPAQFLVNATSSVLTFNADVSGCSSDCGSRLVFIDSSLGQSNGPFYRIGSRFLGPVISREVGVIISPFTAVESSLNFPVTFGTAQQQPPTSVPEPTATVGLLGLGLLGVGSALKRMGK